MTLEITMAMASICQGHGISIAPAALENTCTCFAARREHLRSRIYGNFTYVSRVWCTSWDIAILVSFLAMVSKESN